MLNSRQLLLVELMICWLVGCYSLFAQDVNNPIKHLINGKYPQVISSVTVVGNEKTSSKVIYNELEFVVGDTLSFSVLYDKIGRSRENLLKTSLFNFVNIQNTSSDSVYADIQVKVEERWYWWVFPIFEQGDRNLSSFFREGDWSRANYGVYLKHDNFRGRNEVVQIKVRLGYKNDFYIGYLSREYRSNIGWGMGFNYMANNEVLYGVNSNLPLYVDNGFEFVQQRFTAAFNVSYRYDVHNRHQFSANVNMYQVKDTVVALNPNYLTTGSTSLSFVQINYQYTFDVRNSKYYPLQGNFVRLEIKKDGVGLLTNQLNDLSGRLYYHQYGHLFSKFYYGVESSGKYSVAEKVPFVLKSGLGYRDFLNGYEYYVISGSNFAYSKNKIVFELVPQKVAQLGFIPLRQFSKLHYALYLKTHFDVGYVYSLTSDKQSIMSNSLQYGYGLGLDFVTYYDKAFSFTYSMNKFGNKGFFIHLNMPL